MIVCLHERWFRRCKIFVRGACLLTVGCGALLFLAWIFGRQGVKFAVDLTPTAPNAALGLIFLGLGLWLVRDPVFRKRRRRFAYGIAGAVIVLGATALVDFAMAWDFSLDLMLHPESLSNGVVPVEYLIAPATAVSFILLGFALLTIDSTNRKGRSPSQGFAMVAAMIGLLASAGYFFGPDELQMVAAFTISTMPGVALTLLLSVAILFARPDQGIARTFASDHPGGILMRRLLPITILAPLLIGWFRMIGQQLGFFHVAFGMALFATALSLCFIALLWWSALELNRLDLLARKARERLDRANDQLQRDMSFFRGIAETVPGFLFSWKADGRNTFACPNFYDSTGLSPGSAEGHGWLRALHPDDRRTTIRSWRNALRTKTFLDIKHRLRTAEGDFHWVITRARPVFNDIGQPRAWFGFSTDIEEEKRNETQLEALVAERTAELENRARQLTLLASELTLTEQRERRRLAQVLHDNLQQLLVGARFKLDLLRRRAPDPEKGIVEEVEMLLRESISVSRSLTVELSPPILHDAGLVAAMEWLARWLKEKQGLEIQLELEPALIIEREELRILIFETIRELLLNVTKHAQVDTARITARKIGGGKTIEVIVEDKGAGFDPKAVRAATGEVTGGFGLFNVRERLQLIGGEFIVESAPGHGTRARILVPAESSHTPPRPAPSQTPAAAPNGNGTHPPPAQSQSAGGAIRLLLVDDHAVVRQGLSSLLAAEHDLQIIGEAEDGEMAVEMARQLHPDVILMDFSMPKLDGVQATRIIHAECALTHVIGLSMYHEEDRARAMIEAGADTYLCKAGAADSLVRAIRTIARRPTHHS